VADCRGGTVTFTAAVTVDRPAAKTFLIGGFVVVGIEILLELFSASCHDHNLALMLIHP
jgi:hypothetical protein